MTTSSVPTADNRATENLPQRYVCTELELSERRPLDWQSYRPKSSRLGCDRCHEPSTVPRRKSKDPELANNLKRLLNEEYEYDAVFSPTGLAIVCIRKCLARYRAVHSHDFPQCTTAGAMFPCFG